MAGPQFIPVDHDPFAAAAAPQLIPVDHDPFAKVDPARSWSGVPMEALKNVPGSAGHFAKSIYDAVSHPIDTITGVADVGAGALRAGAKKVLPTSVFNAIDSVDEKKTTDRLDKTATAAGQFFADRYGGSEAIKKTLATDPVGAAADLATVLTGGGAVAARAPGMAANIGRAAQTAGGYIDPLNIAGRAVARTGGAVADGLGVSTGAGARPFREAFRAGETGNQAFTENMRGQVPVGHVVDMAENAVGQMGRERGAAYNASMAGVHANKTPLNFAPVVAAVDNARDLAIYRSPSGRAIVRDQAALDTHTRVVGLVNEFMSLPAAERTATAFDALKQSIGDIRQRTLQGTSERRVADQVYNAVRNEITNQAPDYAAAMRDYAAASDNIGEMRRTMSINDRAMADTTLRKLQSTMRNNVNTNYGARERLLDDLARFEPNLPAALAGQSLNTTAPRGLARISPMSIIAGGAASFNPAALGVLPLTSPRLMGEAVYGAGRVSGAAQRGARRVGVTGERTSNAARNAWFADYLRRASEERNK